MVVSFKEAICLLVCFLSWNSIELAIFRPKMPQDSCSFQGFASGSYEEANSASWTSATRRMCTTCWLRNNNLTFFTNSIQHNLPKISGQQPVYIDIRNMVLHILSVVSLIFFFFFFFHFLIFYKPWANIKFKKSTLPQRVLKKETKYIVSMWFCIFRWSLLNNLKNLPEEKLLCVQIKRETTQIQQIIDLNFSFYPWILDVKTKNIYMYAQIYLTVPPKKFQP